MACYSIVGVPQACNPAVFIYTRTWIERGTVRVSGLTQEHNNSLAEPGSLDSESRALTIAPPCLPQNYV